VARRPASGRIWLCGVVEILVELVDGRIDGLRVDRLALGVLLLSPRPQRRP